MKLQRLKLLLQCFTLGGRMILAEVRPAFDYKDGQRGNKVTGLKVTVALEKNGFDTLTVTVSNPEDRLSSLLEKGDGPVYVDFVNFTARLYTMNGRTDISAKADSVIVVTDDILTVDIS